MIRVAILIAAFLAASCGPSTPSEHMDRSTGGASYAPPVSQTEQQRYQEMIEQARAQRAQSFAAGRAAIMKKGRALSVAGKWSEASAYLSDWHDVEDAEFQKLREHVEAKFSAQIEARAKAEARKRGVTIGMSAEDVLGSAWGRPESVHRTTTAYGSREQWVYGGGQYLYFQDGRLTTIQTAR